MPTSRAWSSSLSRLRMSDEAPSDTPELSQQSWSSTSTTYSPRSGSAVKDLLLSTTSMLTRGEINEYVLALERINPTQDPAYSKLLNGVWDLKSMGFGSPGLVGLQVLKAISPDSVDSVTITISSVAPRVVASTALKVASARINVEVTTDIQAEGGMRLKETVSAVKIGTFDVPLSSVPGMSSLPAALKERSLFITYLDADLLVVRDELGTPEILTRKDASFASSTDTGVPVVDDGDSGAPGV